MTKKSLQAWCNNGDISYSQKEIISKYGVGDYYPEYALRDLKKIWYLNDVLKGESYILSKRLGHTEFIELMHFFSAWWNNNLILVVSRGIAGVVAPLRLNLIVYEMPHKEMREVFKVFWIDLSFGSLDEIKEKLKEAKEKLQSDNPIFGLSLKELTVTHVNDYDCYKWGGFPTFFMDGEVEITDLTPSFKYSDNFNPDDYIKPLDIIKRFRREEDKEKLEFHTGIYLGNRKICHVRGDNIVEIDEWNSFFRVILLNGGTDKLVRYHPVVAFKRPEKIIEHIAKIFVGKEKYFSSEDKGGKGHFGVSRNNCENFANRCVLGFNFSEYIDRKTQDKSKINVEEHINETNSTLDGMAENNNNLISKISEIKEYRNASGYGIPNIMRDGIKMEAYVEACPAPNIIREMISEYKSRYK